MIKVVHPQITPITQIKKAAAYILSTANHPDIRSLRRIFWPSLRGRLPEAIQGTAEHARMSAWIMGELGRQAREGLATGGTQKRLDHEGTKDTKMLFVSFVPSW